MNDFVQLCRFLAIGALGELLYFMIFLTASRQGFGPALSVAVAGGLCVLMNAELHARFSFHSRNSLGKTLHYACIQGLCLVLSVLLAKLLSGLGSASWMIGLATAACWALLSFLLTRRLHRQ